MATTSYPPAAYDAGPPPERRATYMQLRSGEWGIRIPDGARSGDRLPVYRRDGSSAFLTVGVIVWQGQDKRTGGTVAFATIAREDRPEPIGKPVMARIQCANYALSPDAPPPTPAPTPRPLKQPNGAGHKRAARTNARDARRRAAPGWGPPASLAEAAAEAAKAWNDAKAERATAEADKARADAERAIGGEEPLF